MNLIFGRKPVLEALKSGEQLEKIYLLFGQQGEIIYEIRKLVKKLKIPLTELPIEKYKKLSSTSNTQGVIGLKSDRKFFPVEDLIDFSKHSKYPTLLILDSIQDPHNVGAILRTAECIGVDGVVITIHNSAVINETVVKTSAGAVEHLKISKVINLPQILDILKKNGFWIVGTSLVNSINFHQPDYKIPLAIVVGNEEKGIRPIVAKKCDYLVKIPMTGHIQSLNVSVATGILLYEIVRQRNL
jgi:23S rRNA (guanosine2251-2'-O)-methyltransferase